MVHRDLTSHGNGKRIKRHYRPNFLQFNLFLKRKFSFGPLVDKILFLDPGGRRHASRRRGYTSRRHHWPDRRVTWQGARRHRSGRRPRRHRSWRRGLSLYTPSFLAPPAHPRRPRVLSQASAAAPSPPSSRPSPPSSRPIPAVVAPPAVPAFIPPGLPSAAGVLVVGGALRPRRRLLHLHQLRTHSARARCCTHSARARCCRHSARARCCTSRSAASSRCPPPSSTRSPLAWPRPRPGSCGCSATPTRAPAREA